MIKIAVAHHRRLLLRLQAQAAVALNQNLRIKPQGKY